MERVRPAFGKSEFGPVRRPILGREPTPPDGPFMIGFGPSAGSQYSVFFNSTGLNTPLPTAYCFGVKPEAEENIRPNGGPPGSSWGMRPATVVCIRSQHTQPKNQNLRVAAETEFQPRFSSSLPVESEGPHFRSSTQS